MLCYERGKGYQDTHKVLDEWLAVEKAPVPLRVKKECNAMKKAEATHKAQVGCLAEDEAEAVLKAEEGSLAVEDAEVAQKVDGEGLTMEGSGAEAKVQAEKARALIDIFQMQLSWTPLPRIFFLQNATHAHSKGTSNGLMMQWTGTPTSLTQPNLMRKLSCYGIGC